MKDRPELSPGKMVRRLREANDLLQKTVAYRAQIDPSRLARFERGMGLPPAPEVVERILDVLGTGGAERSLILTTVVVDRIAWQAFHRYDADLMPRAQALLRGGIRLRTPQLVAVISLIESMVAMPS